jgi:hypothetical protein
VVCVFQEKKTRKTTISLLSMNFKAPDLQIIRYFSVDVQFCALYLNFISIQHIDVESNVEESDTPFIQASSEIDELLPTTVRVYPMIRRHHFHT